jgi:hypothetical protein
LTTRNDRTELHSPDQHAANSEVSWFFCSVIDLSPLKQWGRGIEELPGFLQSTGNLQQGRNHGTCLNHPPHIAQGVAAHVPPPAALLNSSSESSIEPLGGAGIVMCTQLSAFSTTLTSIPSGTGMSYSARTALGSAMKRAFRASSFQHAANRDASWFFCSVIGLSFLETVVSESWLESSSQQVHRYSGEGHDRLNAISVLQMEKQGQQRLMRDQSTSEPAVIQQNEQFADSPPAALLNSSSESSP